MRRGTMTTADWCRCSTIEGTRPGTSIEPSLLALVEFEAHFCTRRSGLRPTMRNRACGTSALIEGQTSLQKYSTPSTFGSQSMAPTKVTTGADAASELGSESGSEL